jgi:predicted nucleic acid-binding protein
MLNSDSRYDLLRERFRIVETNSRDELCTSIIVQGEIFQGLKKFELEYDSFKKNYEIEKSSLL